MEGHDKSRAWAEINLDSIVHNLKLAKKITGKKVMCVIKGNAHGHGAVECGHALEENGADAFAVACLQEGIDLRKSGIKAPILILGWTFEENTKLLIEYDLIQSVFDEEYANKLNEAAKHINKTLEIHIKLDTGMSRTGLFAQHNHEGVAESIYRISKLTNIKISGIFTHFAAADMAEKDEFTNWQLDNYRKVLKELDKKGFDESVIHHTANSACIMYHPETYFDMVRAGVMLYGLHPKGETVKYGALEPVLALKARVSQIKELPANAYISYGCTFKTDTPTTIAIVTAGYADSYPRSLSNKGAYAIINGHKCRQIGRICMDMCMFDITGLEVRVGDEVTLYGRDGMRLEEVAYLTKSINCEPTCLLTDRVKRVYIRGK